MKLRRITLIAMLSALAVGGRIALMAVSQVKPVLAIVILSGTYLGMSGGLSVGCISMLASNMIFGQGPWTLWQMLSAGIVGALFGIKRVKNTLFLSVLGGVATFAIYGGIMDISSAFMYQPNPSLPTVLSFMSAGLWFNAIHGASTSAFLFALNAPVKKLFKKYAIER